MTYGDVAAALGSRSARAVGSVMAHYGSEVPWWRVVRAGGHPAVGHADAALQHFRAEGTALLWSADGAYRVDLGVARYDLARSAPAAAAARRVSGGAPRVARPGPK